MILRWTDRPNQVFRLTQRDMQSMTQTQFEVRHPTLRPARCLQLTSGSSAVQAFQRCSPNQQRLPAGPAGVLQGTSRAAAARAGELPLPRGDSRAGGERPSTGPQRAAACAQCTAGKLVDCGLTPSPLQSLQLEGNALCASEALSCAAACTEWRQVLTSVCCLQTWLSTTLQCSAPPVSCAHAAGLVRCRSSVTRLSGMQLRDICFPRGASCKGPSSS